MRSDPESPFADDLSDVSELNVEPRLIVNATGAWVDETLRSLKVSEKELLQGTKGTHLFTLADRLREALRGAAIYGEAADGRPAFILPLGSGTLIGTTDDRFSGAPESAVATEQEIDYLIGLVNTLVPDVDLTREDICWHYAGVRPLPKGNNGATGSITRRHFLVENPQAPVPMYSLVGGKLTTCRSLAEEATKKILEGLGQAVVAGSRDRVFPGGEGYPADEVELKNRIEEISAKSGFTCEQTLAVWSLVGTQADRILTSLSAEEQTGLPGTELPMSFVKWIIRNEYVTTLNDLVERRLMLMFNSPPTRETLQSLAELLVQEGILKPEQSADEVLKTEQRLMGHMGYSIHYSPPTA